MQVRWLGWAGVEIEARGDTLVIDPLDDARGVFAPLGEAAAAMPLPVIVPPHGHQAVAGLVTHLHRDHADAAALSGALAPGAPVLEPPSAGGEGLENLALAQADHDLTEAGLARWHFAPWESRAAGPFTVTALPAVDGIGDPQVSWLVEADGTRVLHLGDTMWHGSWWRMALRHGPFDVVLVPVNGAVLTFPHRRPASPLPAALDPAQAALAADILGAGLAIPIHFDGYEIAGIYEPVAGAAQRFAEAAGARGVHARILTPGETLEVPDREELSPAA